MVSMMLGKEQGVVDLYKNMMMGKLIMNLGEMIYGMLIWWDWQDFYHSTFITEEMIYQYWRDFLCTSFSTERSEKQ